jgi:NitT/TauT family transport system substrate-binding protein
MRFATALLLALLLPLRAFAFTIIVTEPDVPLVPNSVLELAQSLGYFAREGVDVQFNRVSGTPMAIAALASGQGDMANVSLDALLKLSARGETRFRAISSPSGSMSYVIVAREEIGSLAQLPGKTFGIGQIGTLDDTLTRTVLAGRGLEQKDLNFVSVGQPQLRLKALKAGKIDATTISYGSWIALPDKSSVRILVSKEDFAHAVPAIAKVNIVSTDTLRGKRDEVRKITAALIKLSRDFARDPQSWAAAMAVVRPDLRMVQLQQLASAYAHDWCVNGCFEAPELQSAADLLTAAPAFNGLPRPQFDTWADGSVLASVLDRLGRVPGERAAAAR